jgi:hypothetical protein
MVIAPLGKTNIVQTGRVTDEEVDIDRDRKT